MEARTFASSRLCVFCGHAEAHPVDPHNWCERPVGGQLYWCCRKCADKAPEHERTEE